MKNTNEDSLTMKMMKFVILIALVGASIAGSWTDNFEDVKHMFEYPPNEKPYTANLSDYNPTAHDFIYFLYNLQETSYPAPAARQLRYTDVAKFKQFYNPNKQTLIIFHGYWTNSTKPIEHDIVLSAIQGKHDFNIIVADYAEIWTKISDSGFFANAQKIGHFASDFFKSTGMEFSKTLLVGFSAGGILAGACGRGIGGKARALVGLDTWNIDKSCAQYVEVVHTTSGSGGAGSGHSDFYPNGGSNQAGCPDNKGCSHGRAFQYFSESVNDKKFVAHKCDSWDAYKGGKCSSQPSAVMGTLEVDTKASGKYFLATGTSWPYSKG